MKTILPSPTAAKSPDTSEALGEHWLLEFYDCPVAVLNDPDRLKDVLSEACQAAGLHLLQSLCHAFTPQGVTVVGLLSESHLSIHTWPEKGYAALDIFTCDPTSRLDKALETLLAGLAPQRHVRRVVKRGEGHAR